MRDKDLALSWIEFLEFELDNEEREYERAKSRREHAATLCEERDAMSKEESTSIFVESRPVVGESAWETILDCSVKSLTRDFAYRAIKPGKSPRHLRRAMHFFDRLFPHYLHTVTLNEVSARAQRIRGLYDKLQRADACYDRCSGKATTSANAYALCTCSSCTRKTSMNDS